MWPKSISSRPLESLAPREGVGERARPNDGHVTARPPCYPLPAFFFCWSDNFSDWMLRPGRCWGGFLLALGAGGGTDYRYDAVDGADGEGRRNTALSLGLCSRQMDEGGDGNGSGATPSPLSRNRRLPQCHRKLPPGPIRLAGFSSYTGRGITPSPTGVRSSWRHPPTLGACTHTLLHCSKHRRTCAG